MSEQHEISETESEAGIVDALPEEVRLTEENITEELRIESGLEIDDNGGNEILVLMAELACSNDLLLTQRSIVTYESGDAPLFRSLGRILDIGEVILESDQQTVSSAFSHLREKLVDEETAAKAGNRKNNGIKNIGVPSMPVTDQKFFKKIREDSFFLYKTLINFYLPLASSAMRTQYYTIVNWAHEKQEPNFVTWLAGDHEVTISGNQVFKRGLKGAYLHIKQTQPLLERPAMKTDDLIDKAFENTNKIIPAPKPEWLDECVDDIDEPFMMLGRVVGNEIQFINRTTSNVSYIKSSIKASSGSLFASDLNYSEGEAGSKMVNAIKSLVPFSGAPELIIWQDANTQTYIMPLYDEWINDDQPNVRKTNPALHFAAIIDIFNAYDGENGRIDELTFPETLDTEFDNDANIFQVGYITNQVDKVLAFKGNWRESFTWVNDDQQSFDFLGAQWTHVANRKPKKRNEKDKELKRVRQPTIGAYGYKYIMACKYYENGVLSSGETLCRDIDFELARAKYKKWVGIRKAAGLKEHPDHIVICADNGTIGVWYENVITDDIIRWDNHKQLIKVGSAPKWLKGQWRVATYQLRRVWNLITGPWELYLPQHIEDVRYHPEPNLGSRALIGLMEREKTHLPYGRMRNLCSTREIDDGKITIMPKDDDGEPKVFRKCVPLVLRCGALWVYLFNETR